MPRGQYDRTKTKEQRAAEKKTAAGKGAKKSAPAVTSPVAVKAKAEPSPLKTEWKDAAPLNVERVEKKYEMKEDLHDLRNEMDRVATLLTNLATNRLTLGDCGNVGLLGRLEQEATECVEHLAVLRRLLPHGLRQPGADKVEIKVSLSDLQTGEKERIAAEVARRRSTELPKPPKTAAEPATLQIPNPIPLPGTGPVSPPVFMPVAAQRPS